MSPIEPQTGGAPHNDGDQKAPLAAEAQPAASGTGDAPCLHDKVIAALCEVYDPEIPVNIYELGLVYDIDIDAQNKVSIKMTLTSPACPVAESLPGQVQASVSRVAEVTACEVDVVWDPPWAPDKMSEVAKLKLGMM